jgi:hypothetical protein
MDPKDIENKDIRKNVAVVLSLIDRRDFYAVVRDVECISLEWPKSGLFCCIYDDGVDVYQPPNMLGSIQSRDLKEQFMSVFSRAVFIE